jgi:hypothetical protein
LNRSQTGERKFFGPALVKDAEEKMRVIRENLRISQERQKSHYDKGKTPREYKVGDGTQYYGYQKIVITRDYHIYDDPDIFFGGFLDLFS